MIGAKNRRRAGAVLLGVSVALSMAAAPALANGNQVLSECVTGQLTRHFTIAQLKSALHTMSPSTRQYTSCEDVINEALAAAIRAPRSDRGTGGGSGSFLPTPVIVILALLFVGALSLGVVAARRSQQAG